MSGTSHYLMKKQVQRAVAHELGDDAEELGLVADPKDLDDVVEAGFVKHLRLLEQTLPLSETQQKGQVQNGAKVINSNQSNGFNLV